jgi:hypothetical protein
MDVQVLEVASIPPKKKSSNILILLSLSGDKYAWILIRISVPDLGPLTDPTTTRSNLDPYRYLKAEKLLIAYYESRAN